MMGSFNFSLFILSFRFFYIPFFILFFLFLLDTRSKTLALSGFWVSSALAFWVALLLWVFALCALYSLALFMLLFIFMFNIFFFEQGSFLPLQGFSPSLGFFPLSQVGFFPFFSFGGIFLFFLDPPFFSPPSRYSYAIENQW